MGWNPFKYQKYTLREYSLKTGLLSASIHQQNLGRIFSCLTLNHKFIIRLLMKQIIKNIYHVGDNECSVYMVDTQSDEGLVLIDAGMNLDMIRQINSHGILFENIQHCILTHCHIDHIGICAQLSRELSDIYSC
jgi:predicted metal-dependent RNase